MYAGEERCKIRFVSDLPLVVGDDALTDGRDNIEGDWLELTLELVRVGDDVGRLG